jgi:hypothetical protein
MHVGSILRPASFAIFFLRLSLLPAHAQRHVDIHADIQLLSYESVANKTSISKVENAFSVRCTVGTNNWRIDNNAAIGGFEACLFDGTNIYDGLGHLQTNSWGRIQTPTAINVIDSSEGCTLGNVGLNIPWLAFCSGQYLKGGGRIVPLPIARLRNSPDSFAYTDQTQVFEDGLGLPRHMALFSSQALLASSVSNKYFLGVHDLSVWQRGTMGFRYPSQDGVLKFSYSVIEATNLLGWNFPLKFEWFNYSPDAGDHSVLRGGGKGQVTAIHEGKQPDTVFTTNVQQTIVDWRFRDEVNKVNGLVYTSTNGYALSPTDPDLQLKFANHVREVTAPR